MLKEFQIFCNVDPHKILRPAQTRWLSLLSVVRRILEQWEPLIVICIARLRNPTLTNREKNCRQGRFAAETRQSRGRQRIS
jgi:hypothetical protein